MKSENHSDNQPGSGQSGLDLEEINERHVNSIDKLYRMYAGAGSEITGFERGTIYLAITIDERQQPPFDEIAGKIARSWLHEEELKNASQYVAVIFQTDGRLGGVLNPRAVGFDAVAEQLAKQMRSAEKPDVPIAVISDAFVMPTPNET